jgi:hypothetical protein
MSSRYTSLLVLYHGAGERHRWAVLYTVAASVIVLTLNRVRRVGMRMVLVSVLLLLLPYREMMELMLIESEVMELMLIEW